MALLSVTSTKNSVTVIPNSFIDQFITTAKPSFISLFLFFYRHYDNPELSTEMIAEAFEMREPDVINAFKYWEKVGVIKMDESDKIFNIDLLFPDQLDTPIKSQPSQKTSPVNPETKPINLETKPVYSAEELAIYQEDSLEVQKLFSLAEQALGKLLQYNDMNTLFYIYDWLRMPMDVIEILLKYCEENDKRSMAYIEKTAVDWMNRGINNKEAATNYLNRFSNEYSQILKALGHSNRGPATAELKYMEKWLIDFSLEIILEACDKTIMQIGKPQLSYVDRILEDWNKSGIKTIEDVKDFEKNHRSNAKTPVKESSRPSTKKSTKPNRFANFEQRKWDEDELKKLETAYLR